MTKKDYYEIHMTLDENESDDAVIASMWTSSKIDGDPDLGTGVRHYRTAHTKTEVEARHYIEDAKILWPNALRYKIEHVIFDERRPKQS